ncbi:hypothetical protein SUGI_0314230 [Cryptomeria japonica]|nr:hypothetical protein SUGI_0314230 [Cryptomeria japonica]
MDRGSKADSGLSDSRIIISARSVESASCRWKTNEAQKRRLESIFASGTRNPSFEQINPNSCNWLQNANRLCEKLQAHGAVGGMSVFYWFQNPSARRKRQKKMRRGSG